MVRCINCYEIVAKNSRYSFTLNAEINYAYKTLEALDISDSDDDIFFDASSRNVKGKDDGFSDVSDR